ncbi:GxxExxY protein [Algoriphagus antarcticus]|uniref:GxxExxY protein n=1 Tax=Algoriphagus antarcticus TaxID=238540 RepID=A0A3E0DX59_9BACT|nr:GxxExxY protein [Algoriphagus antarcticus]
MIEDDLILENELATKVIGIAIDVHSQLGPGLLENAYKQVLAYKLQKAGIFVEVEKKMPLLIDGISIEVGYSIDILVERKLVLELKSVEILNDVHFA